MSFSNPQTYGAFSPATSDYFTSQYGSLAPLQGNKLPWIACNAPPRYNIPLLRSHCQDVYDRIIYAPQSYRKQGWHGINTPEPLTEESDDCVVRLETNYRDQSDTFSRALMAHVGLHISQQCILGGAASIGSKGFYISVTGMVPAKMLENGTTVVSETSTAEAATA